MRKLAFVSTAALALSLGALGVSSAEAQGYGYHRGYGGYAARGPAYRGYGYRNRGVSPGAAVGLGIAGLAAGAIAAEIARRQGYYGAPRYYDEDDY